MVQGGSCLLAHVYTRKLEAVKTGKPGSPKPGEWAIDRLDGRRGHRHPPAGLRQGQSNACTLASHKSGDPGTTKTRNREIPEHRNRAIMESGNIEIPKSCKLRILESGTSRDQGVGWRLGRGDNAARQPLSRHVAENVQRSKS